MANFPTLSRSPSFPLAPDGEIEDSTLRSQFEAGYELTRPRFTRARRSWGVRYPVVSSADKALLVAFEQTTVRGGADSFSWTHPITSTVYSVRFAGPLKYAQFAIGKWSVEFMLREV